jgi:hypothetical protein
MPRRAPASTWTLVALIAALTLLPAPARATPDDLLRPGDPIEYELRVLEVLGPGSDSTFDLPHFGLRPFAMRELTRQVPGRVGGDDPHTTLARRIAEQRVTRALWFDGPDAGRANAPRDATPRLVQLAWPGRQHFEMSAGFEGGARLAQDSLPRWISSSGLHVRTGAMTDHWLAYLHLVAGYVDSARTFADPIVPGNDVTTFTDEAYLAYTADDARWSIVIGRDRWGFGPGQEGTLMLSSTSAPFTALAMRARIPAIRADGISINGTLQAAAGEQIAAHRLEWEPKSGLRIGLSEAVRYQGSSWQPLYLIGVIPYTLVQRLEVQDEPDSAGTLRNNVMVGGDVAWRVAPGTRVYGELVIDDLHARTASVPNKYGYQLGLDGAGVALGQRLTWGAEFTRVSRYVYTSFFGQSFVAQGRPLGWPYGPDTRRFRVRGTWDPSADWSLLAATAWTDQGEADLGTPFIPGSPSVDASEFLGVVTSTREAELGVRWWPRSGVIVETRAGYRWVDDADHVSGAGEQGAYGTAYLKLMR